MPDFSSLLRQPAGQAKKPEVLPAGNYGGTVSKWEMGDNNKNKTPYVRLTLIPNSWPDDAEPLDGVDLTKRVMRRDYYMTSDAMYLIDRLLSSCGIEMEGETYDTALPKLIGQPVVIAVTQRTIERDGEADVINDVRNVTGQS